MAGGSGTQEDPWRIETRTEMASILRDPSSSGFYRVVNDLASDGVISVSLLSLSVANGYSAKVIDLAGYSVIISAAMSSSNGILCSGIHFANGNLILRLTINQGGYEIVAFHLCSLTDITVRERRLGSATPSVSYFLKSDLSTPHIIPRSFERVTLQQELAPSSPVTWLFTCALAGVAAAHCYVYTTGTVTGGMIKQTVPLTLALLDSLSGGAFTDAGWWQDGVTLLAGQAEIANVSVMTLLASPDASRLVWLESNRSHDLLGTTDSDGLAQFAVRVRKHAAFTLVASEDWGAQVLRVGLAVVAGNYYITPTATGYVYQAQAAGRLTTAVNSATFAHATVTVDGIDFVPRKIHPPVISDRRSVATHGTTQAIELNAAGGGGGPVIEGDPAYLDGIVEEQHPTLGTIRPLANSEVAVFERRGDTFVAMGRALSNSVGEFRVQTEIYGGGDVFAFAVDFPGVTWQPAVALSIGDRVRPTVNNGYVYEVVSAGTSGATEPDWWPDAGGGTEGFIGTARAKARPYYQPVGDGPRKMTFV